MRITGVIYIIRNTVTNMVYVGQSRSIKQRIKTHFYTLEKGTHKNPHLQNSWNKHGKDSFVMEELLKIDNQRELNAAEIRIIAEKKAKGIKLYNCRAGGFGGGTFNEETRKKISTANKARKLTVETRKKISDTKKGIKHTEETKQKMREAWVRRRKSKCQ